jgi:hypothetical protein
VPEYGRSVREAMDLLTRGGVEACVGEAVGVDNETHVVLGGADCLGSARVGVCSGRGR